MKKSVIAVLALSLMIFTGVANANVIGIFGDPDATVCDTDMLAQYTTVTVHFVALLSDVGSISAAEFGATGINLAGTMPTVTWDTGLVIGDIMSPDGVALAFNPVLDGPVAHLGTIAYFLLAPQAPDVMMSVVPSGAGNLVVVDAADSSTHDAMGWSLVVNCSAGAGCACDVIATDDSSWSEVKSLY
jgi:hypothetical protein